MKKIELIISIFIFFMFIPFIVNAKTCDTDKISIESVKIEEKTDGVEENKEASFNDKDVNLNLSLTKEGDSIKYKIIVKNNSKDDYLLDKNYLNINSEYIDYSLESDDNSNIVKAESQKQMFLNIKYKKRIPNEAFKSGKYNENKTMPLSLSTKSINNKPNVLKNPNTKTISYLSI